MRSEAAKMGLIINENKTKFVKTCSGTVPQQEGTVVNIGGQQFEVVDEFVYLGVLIRADSDNSKEIKRRVMAANRCFHGLQRHLRSKLLTNETKCRIYKTLIRPVLLYGCESWPTRKEDEQLLLAFERKVLRAIFGAVREGERYRRRYNFELQRSFAEPNIVSTVKAHRLRWAGHLARMESTRAPLVLFNTDPQGSRGPGRPKKRWIDGVQEDLRALGVQNWMAAAQDRNYWNDVVQQAKSKPWT